MCLGCRTSRSTAKTADALRGLPGFTSACSIDFADAQGSRILVVPLQFHGHLLFDNMKTVVLERDAYGLGQHRFQPKFKMFRAY